MRFNNANSDLMDNAIKINVIMAVLMPVMMLIMNLTTVALIWFGALSMMSPLSRQTLSVS